jgi:predicted DNA-binding transcriptional regulator YafY
VTTSEINARARTPDLRSALRKLVRALPQTFRADAEAAAGAVTVDAARWGENEPPRDDLVETLQTAVVRRRKISLTYGGRGGPTQRLVDPWGLVAKAGVWYLIAGTDKGQRTFRVDRIVAAVVTDLVAERPADFVLSQAWQRVVDEVEAKRSLVETTVLIDTRYLHALRSQFGRHCHVEWTGDDGCVRVRLAAPTPLMIAQWLAGWGALVEDVDSGPVRAELARLAAELTALYSKSSTG